MYKDRLIKLLTLIDKAIKETKEDIIKNQELILVIKERLTKLKLYKQRIETELSELKK